MKILKGILFLLVFSFYGTISHAALMQTTWTATVSSGEEIPALGIDIGDVFTAVTVFDNTSKTNTQYYDGIDQIAEFGAGDDTVKYSYTLSSSIYSGQVQFSLSSNFHELFAAVDNYYGYNGYENTVENWVYQQQYSSYGTRFNYHADGITFEYRYGWYTDPTNGLIFWRNYGPGYNDNYYDQLAIFENITMTTSPYNSVPIPSALSMLSLGLLSIAGISRKKK